MMRVMTRRNDETTRGRKNCGNPLQTKISSQTEQTAAVVRISTKEITHADGMTTTTTTTTISLSHFRRRGKSSSSLSRRVRILQRTERRIFTNTTNNELAFFVDEEEEEEEDLEEEEDKEEEESWIGEKDASKSTTIEPFVLRETKDILAVYKPHGLGFHSEFSDGLVKKLRKMKEKDERFYECENIYPVHRLDKPTSGIVLFATKKSVATSLSRAFESKRIVKYYVGVSERKPRKKMGTVTGDLKKARRGMYKLMRTMENPSKTTFVSRGFTAEVEKKENNLRFFLFKPETGKTHQLRVVAKSLGSALLGDEMYGTARKSNSIDRMYLHACAVRVPKLEVVDEDEGGGGKYETEPFQIVCAPKEGEYWGPDAFREWFEEGMDQECGPWFDDISLLRSTNVVA